MKKETEKIEAGMTSGETVFEGITSIRSLIDAAATGLSDRKITKIYCDEAKTSARKGELGWLRHRAEEQGFTIETLPTADVEALALGSSHGGLLALCTGRTIPPITDFKPGENCFAAMLEGIEDPYNFGYALRSLWAAGADAVILPPRSWMSAAGIVCRSSAGASELMPMYVSEGAAASEYLKSYGLRTVCADVKNSVPLADADMSRPIFLVVGGERRGISSALLNRADTIVRIDYGRQYNASLSAASATAILAFEVTRRTGGAVRQYIH